MQWRSGVTQLSGKTLKHNLLNLRNNSSYYDYYYYYYIGKLNVDLLNLEILQLLFFFLLFSGQL